MRKPRLKVDENTVVILSSDFNTDIHWINPDKCLAPHSISRPEEVADLVEDFAENGWDTKQSLLVGYTIGDKIQLINGTHRHAAATILKLEVPVMIYSESEVWNAWGDLNKWAEILQGY